MLGMHLSTVFISTNDLVLDWSKSTRQENEKENKPVCSKIALAPFKSKNHSITLTHSHTSRALGCIRFDAKQRKTRVQMSEYCIDCVFFSNTFVVRMIPIWSQRHVASDEKTSPRHLEGMEHSLEKFDLP
jgi:hypothetical protein